MFEGISSLEGIEPAVIHDIILLCDSILKTTNSIQNIISVFSIFNRLCACHYILIDLLDMGIITQKIELLNNTTEEIASVFTLLSNLLHQYEDASILEEIVILLFNVVFKGYKYHFLVEKVNNLFEEYKDNSFIFDLFDKFIPDAYQNALLIAINSNESLDSICDLICAYLFNERNNSFCE